MEMYYSVNDILENFNISKATFYNQAKKNKDFFTKNSIKVKPEGKNGKPLTKYNQSVFDFFASQYKQEGKGESEEEAPLLTVEVLEASQSTQREPHGAQQGQSIGESPENLLETKIKALEAEIEGLKAQLAEMKGERDKAQEQLGIALLCLQQEKAEKQLLLPAPNKGLFQKIKGLFHK